jgi:hypothetical protein
MFTVDSAHMEWDLRALRLNARKAAELGTNLGHENKTEAEIRDEVEELVCKALLEAIRIYNKDNELESWHTPEHLYKRLWDDCYDYARTDMDDVDEETKELVDRALEESFFYLQNVHDNRLVDFAEREDANEDSE